MYTSFYQLDSKPFDHSFEQKFYWEGEVQRDALSTMQRGLLHNRKFLYLKGSEGTGKTTLVHALTRSLGNDFAWARVDEPSLDRIEFYNDIGAAFGLDQKFTSKVQFLIRFSHFLYRTNEEEKKILLLIDECHQLSQELVDELWLLSNIEKGGTRLLNIYFIGQHLFDELLLKPKNNAVRQRITRNVELVPLDVESTADYIRHRVKAAGGYDALFAPEAIQAVHRYCRGNMQQINMLCDNALSTGSVKEKRTIDQEIIDECAFKLGFGGEAAASVAAPQEIVQGEVKAVDEPAAAAREVAVPMPGPEVQEETGGGWLKYAAGVVALGLAGLALYLWWPGMQTMDTRPVTEGDSTLAVSADDDVSQSPAARASGAEQDVAEEQVSQSSLAAVADSVAGSNTAEPSPPDVRAPADEAMTDLPQKQPEAAVTAAAQGEGAALDVAAVPDTAGQTVLARESEPQDTGLVQQQQNPRGTTGGADRITGSEAVVSADTGEKSADDNTLGQTTAPLEPEQPVDAAALVIAEAEREAAAAADANRKATAVNSEVTAAPVATLTGTSEEPAAAQVAETEPQPAAAAAPAPMEPNKVILALRPSSLQLTREGKREFDRFVDALRDYPQAKLLVKGFVSAKTNSDENIQLSEDRAKSVQKLLTARGIAEERIEVKGMGNLEPIASNNTREGRNKNRRVEIVVVDDGT